MKRKIHRLFFYGCKFFIGMVVYFNSRLYMKLYNMLLNTTGLTINGTPRFIAKSVKFDDFNLISIIQMFPAELILLILIED